MRTKTMAVLAALAALQASLAMANYVVFNGQNNNPAAPIGALSAADNWAGGVLPSGSSTGLVGTTVNVWTGTAWNNLAVRQTGGYVSGGTAINLRGGLSGSGITTIYEIEDSRTDYGSYTNLATTGSLTLWSQWGEKMELSLLSGHVEADSLNLNAAGKGTIRMKDGILHARLLNQASGTLKFLSGGGGTVSFDEMASGIFGNFYIDFASDSSGSFHVGEVTGGGNTKASIEWLVNNGRVSIDGTTSTDWADYTLVVDGTASTIALADAITPAEAYAAWAAGYGLADPGGTGAMEADPDGDGRSNLAEYAMGGNPVDGNDAGHVPLARQVAAGGTNWLEHVHFERADKADLGLGYHLECGPNLINPDWTDSQIEFVGSGPFNADFDAVTNRIPTDLGGSHFIRLRVELQE